MVKNIILVALLIPVLFVRVVLAKIFGRFGQRRQRKPVLAFFHPFCNDGGGGERVLWNMVVVTQRVFGDSHEYRLYHGDVSLSGQEILGKTRERFGIELPLPMQFVKLRQRQWVESSAYPSFTMLGQALGGIVLGYDALLQEPDAPDIMFDTMGFAFAYPVFSWLGGCRVFCYTHYPIISTDMLARVLERRPSHNNAAAISNSVTLSLAKSFYYMGFAWWYGWAGRWAELVMVNSSWTRNHIDQIWKCPARTHIVYPAVDTAAVEKFPLEPRESLLISIAQFRPEKDHVLQVRSFAAFLGEWRKKNSGAKAPHFIMIGSVRNSGDEQVVASIRKVAEECRLVEGEDYSFAFNIRYADLLDYLKRAKVGIHSMWNEHFGIGVVELLAAGVITVAHDSGGPKCDILAADPQNKQVGFAADTVEGYAAALMKAFELQGTEMQLRARKAMKKFSVESFDKSVEKLLLK